MSAVGIALPMRAAISCARSGSLLASTAVTPRLAPLARTHAARRAGGFDHRRDVDLFALDHRERVLGLRHRRVDLGFLRRREVVELLEVLRGAVLAELRQLRP